MDKVLNLDPNDIAVVENARFGLKKTRIDRLVSEIERDGEIHTPVMVELLPEPIDDKLYRLVTGHYRHASALAIQKKGNAITVPAMVVKFDNDLSRLKRQISENNERENLSPMDEAIIIKKLLAQDVTRADLRTMFARPWGKAKSLKNEPASNSFLNMRTSFLDLPKNIQEWIHDGRLGVKAAYELTQYAPEKRAEVFAKAEKAWAETVDKDANEEAAFLAKEQKASEVTTKLEQAQNAVAATATDLETAIANRDAAQKSEGESFMALQKARATKDKAVIKKADEHHKAMMALARSAEKLADEKQKEADKLKTKLEASKKKADELAAKLAAQRAAKKGAKPTTPAQPISSKDVAKAAAEVGAKPVKGQDKSGVVAMNGTQVKQMIVEAANAAGSYPKVQAIYKAFEQTIASSMTPQALYTALAKITGEYVAPKTAPAKK